MPKKITPSELTKQLTLGLPAQQGLYNPLLEKDSCGVGFICDIKGRPSRSIIEHAEHMNCCMVHRGGVGYEQNTGDGAGILTGLPHSFLKKIAREELKVELPEPGSYGVGIVFLPRSATERQRCKEVIETATNAAGQRLIGWRPVPTDPAGSGIGNAALSAMPHMEQLFIAANGIQGDAFERELYVIRKHSTHLLRNDNSLAERQLFYVVSLSTKIIIYKGMLTPQQVFPFFIDLNSLDYESHLAMVHSRFSTNTFPSWDRAQPNRFMSHNGEINTLLGNKNWMNARQGTMESNLFGDRLEKLFPIVEPECSDSGTFDNVLEFLLMSGRTLQEAVLMMIPEAWQQDKTMDEGKRAFYEYQSCLMEPWDGPASIAFTDGNYIGAVLDRNGLLPSRYYITDDDKCIMASEVGVVNIDPSKILEKGRLKPGKIFLIDFEAGRMIPDEEIKGQWAKRRPYSQWLQNQRIELRDLPTGTPAQRFGRDALLTQMQAFGYTTETMQFMLQPLVRELRDPLGSMGNDSALAVMSEKPRMLYDYFKQLFAQVTNPAIDSIREEVIMALECYIGPEQNLLESEEKNAHRMLIPHPILSNASLAALKSLNFRGWKSHSINITFPRGSGEKGFLQGLDRVCTDATAAIEGGVQIIILTDRGIGHESIPMSALSAVGAVHHHLVRSHLRTRVGIIVETGEAREVHHHCLLIGYGADAINPYLAFEALWDARSNGYLDGSTHINTDQDIVAAYKKGVAKGMLKVMAKMGISTLQSYKGAQIFEAVGLRSEVIEKCFTGTASRVEGVGFEVLAQEMETRHCLGFPPRDTIAMPVLQNPGDFHWRRHGDTHMWDPKAISYLQLATRTNDKSAYADFANHANNISTKNATLRGLLHFNLQVNDGPIPIDEVEPEQQILKRFATGAMSFGSISQEAHESLAVAMNRIGGKSNTGEGGEDPKRYIPLDNGDSKRSAIKQVASGRFGVTINYLSNADELQIKIVQGAKPGEGGELPGGKVDEYIASLRHSTPGVGLISPPPHHDIYSIEDIAQLIHDLKNSNPNARISVKLGAAIGVGTVAAGVVKARTDHLVIAGDSGGTGASPLTSIKHAGVPWDLGIAETHQTLVMNNLRVIMSKLGFKTVNEMIGRTDALHVEDAVDHWKAGGIDLSNVLQKAIEPENCLGVYRIHDQDHGLEKALDNRLIELAEPALANGTKVKEKLSIQNTDRVVGGMLSNRIIRSVGSKMLPEGTIHFKFNGSAGQSFGAWLAKGVTLEVEGDANDYVGKGLSGGCLIIYPPKVSTFVAENQILIGNVGLYGATSGESYFRGIAAERFCVRNSGAHTVIEGVGDHGCEYMTGGRVVILGKTGRNFGAGMSGGIAYIFDKENTFEERCNPEMVVLERIVENDDIAELRGLIEKHVTYTGSKIAKNILNDWTSSLGTFVKVMPLDYKRVLEQQRKDKLTEVGRG